MNFWGDLMKAEVKRCVTPSLCCGMETKLKRVKLKQLGDLFSLLPAWR